MNTYKCCSTSGKDLARTYAKGKSFDFTVWNPQKTYVNDDYKQDFVSYQGKLYACIRTNTDIAPTNTFYWVLCVSNLGGEITTINSPFLIGNEIPTEDASENTIFLDLSSGCFYQMIKDRWESLGEINSEDSLTWK